MNKWGALHRPGPRSVLTQPAAPDVQKGKERYPNAGLGAGQLEALLTLEAPSLWRPHHPCCR